MKALEMHKIRKQLIKALDSKRYEHTQGVAYTSAALAMRYGEDIRKAELAGLLHDCAKCLDNEKKINICKKNDISISDAEQRNPFLLHAKVGGHLAKTKYKIDDEDIINAILYHTTGRPGMSLLEKIVYIADYIEPGRDHEPNLDEVRSLSFQDLDEALLRILEDILVHLKESSKEIDPMTQMTYEFYKRKQSEE
ncbi:MAG: bis(5'-nucleosyl)-tetraphosphatase (symmetrical) YqeK [Lachnospiraceae bacterium]|nr:bis(5'-nucleosyl)-tetraphosphatase (symmetrical) YqeK [Lachnospiraceae bacterium]